MREFINTVLEEWGADTLTFYESTPFVSRALPISLVRIPTTHMKSQYSKQRNAGKSQLNETLPACTFWLNSRALPISLVRIPTTPHMEGLYSKQEMRERVDSMSRLFLTEFMNTVLEEWGQIH
jgi:hypothetical protein